MLYGTLWILLIAFITIEMPAAYQQLSTAFKSLNPELEEASRILGATRVETLRQITAPLLRTNVIATWCLIFIGTIRELSATILLTTANTKIVSVIIYDLNESGDLGAISVLGNHATRDFLCGRAACEPASSARGRPAHPRQELSGVAALRQSISACQPQAPKTARPMTE